MPFWSDPVGEQSNNSIKWSYGTTNQVLLTTVHWLKTGINI